MKLFVISELSGEWLRGLVQISDVLNPELEISFSRIPFWGDNSDILHPGACWDTDCMMKLKVVTSASFMAHEMVDAIDLVQVPLGSRMNDPILLPSPPEPV